MKRHVFSHWVLLVKLKIHGTIDSLIGKGIIQKKYFIQFLPKNPVIVEAGAHKGKDTVEMARTWPEGMVHAFEPVPRLFEKLESRTKNYPNVRYYQSGLSDKSGRQEIYISSGASDGSSSLLKPKGHLKMYPTVYFDNTLEIDVVTLDDWSRENSIDRVDFMWLDLQGMELNVLQSGMQVIPTVKAIYTEVSRTETYENQCLYQELKDWLSSQGFRIEREEIKNGSGNVLFVRH